MFVLASAIVGFKGWPQVDAQPSTASLQAVQTQLPRGGSTAAAGAHGPAALQAAVAAQTPGAASGGTPGAAGSSAPGGARSNSAGPGGQPRPPPAPAAPGRTAGPP